MQSTKYGEVLVLIDWDNLFICLQERFGAEMRLENRIQALIEWIKSDIGEIWREWGFVFAPDYLTIIHRDIFVRNNLRLMICPKKQIGEMQMDTVDETLIWFGEAMLNHPEIGFICLVSGDADYVKFLEKAKKAGVKIALAPPTINSLSRDLVGYANINPKTGKKIILRLDTLFERSNM